MLNQTHSAHSGISACKRRIKEVMYWPGISRDMEKFVEECKIYKQNVEITNKHETLQQHDREKSPWAKIGMDLCQIGDRTLLVLTYYYSNFLSVEKVDNTNIKGIIKILLKMFAIHGIPQEIVSDNGPQFRSEFKECTRNLDIRHTTSSPYHPQGNGKRKTLSKRQKGS